MSRLMQALQAAEQRKAAITGDSEPGLVFTQNEAAFLGFDLDYEEVAETAHRVGHLFTSVLSSGEIGPRPMFTSAWTDGFLVGLFAGKSLGENE